MLVMGNTVAGAGRPRDDFERELLPQLEFFRNMARKMCRNDKRAEDLYGDTILKMLAHKDSYQLGTTIRGWGISIMRNTLSSYHRRSWRWQEWNDAFDVTLKDADDPHAKLEFKEVMDAMQYLEPPQAEALMMIAEGMSYEEAAFEVGCEVGTMKSRVSRGRKVIERLFNA